MTFLYASGGQCFQSGEVLGKAHRRDDAGEFLCRAHPKNFQTESSGGVYLGSATHKSDSHGQLDSASKIAIGRCFPCGEAGVAPGASCVGVCTSLHGTRVVASGQHHGTHAIHDALVVGGGAVGVGVGKMIG